MTLRINPYLNFDGDCRRAMQTYAEIFGGTLTVQTFAESPMADHVGPDEAAKVVHAHLEAEGFVLMGSDSTGGRYGLPHSMAVMVSAPTAEEAHRLFERLSDGGEVHMAIGPTYWTTAFAMVRDRFAIPWMITCDQAPDA